MRFLVLESVWGLVSELGVDDVGEEYCVCQMYKMEGKDKVFIKRTGKKTELDVRNEAKLSDRHFQREIYI